MKPYTITFEERPQYLYVLVEGENDSYEISRQFWTEIVDYLKGKEYEKVLVVERLEETVSTEDVYRLVTEFPQMGLTGLKIAFVDEVLDQYTINQFGEIVALNLDLNGKIFNDVDRAEGWLLEDERDTEVEY
jgi:hypothetical protein